MGVLSTTRSELAQMLKDAGLNAHAYKPDRLPAPSAIVEGNPTYLASGETFTGLSLLTYDVSLVIRPASNPAEDKQLDDMLETAWTALVEGVGNDMVSITSSDKFIYVDGTAQYRVVTITLTVRVKF